MSENQIHTQPGYQQNQPLKDNLKDNPTQSGTFQSEDSEINDRTSEKEFPERTHQPEYKDPSANHNEDDEEELDDDELNTDGEAFDQDYETNTNFRDKHPTDVSDLGLV